MSGDTRLASCAQCGAPFAVNRRGRPQKFCRVQCGWAFHSAKRPKATRPVVECAHCGKPFQRFNALNTLCSNACKVAAYKARNPDLAAESRERERKAARASAKVLALIAKERRLYRRWSREAKRRQNEKTHRPCLDCGATMPVERWVVRCQPCRAEAKRRAVSNYKASPSGRAMKAACKARRRSRLKQSKIEAFDPFEIFARDGWHCHMCGCKTPKSLRGTFEDNAPELDHLVPLAAGGEHSRRNTACSCRKCNLEKGDKPLGQLRLIA